MEFMLNSSLMYNDSTPSLYIYSIYVSGPLYLLIDIHSENAISYD